MLSPSFACVKENISCIVYYYNLLLIQLVYCCEPDHKIKTSQVEGNNNWWLLVNWILILPKMLALRVQVLCSRKFWQIYSCIWQRKLWQIPLALANLNPASSFFKYCKQFVDKTLTNL